jgi:lipopolysaccharide/colanic/teichoic acid biosynthesis glycosyltransferase
VACSTTFRILATISCIASERVFRLAWFAISRAVDLAIAAILLAALLPLILMIALCIVAESRGPVFYGARRVGYRGREFRMLKFRKMRVDACGPQLTASSDPRLTRVGSVLTNLKLDELPQLINVLRGEMSLTGPRPEDPVFVACFPGEFQEILSVRPGMTGLCQIAFAREREILSTDDPVGHYIDCILPQKLSLDRVYVRRRGMVLDGRILLWTAAATVFRTEVAVDRTTGAMGRRRRRTAAEPATLTPSQEAVPAAAVASSHQEAT